VDGWPNCTLYEFITGLFVARSHILYRPLELQDRGENIKTMLLYFIKRSGYKQIENHDYGCINKMVFQHYAQEREITMKEFYSTNKSRASSTLVLECDEILPF
jgi:hypothetical protein